MQEDPLDRISKRALEMELKVSREEKGREDFANAKAGREGEGEEIREEGKENGREGKGREDKGEGKGRKERRGKREGRGAGRKGNGREGKGSRVHEGKRREYIFGTL